MKLPIYLDYAATTPVDSRVAAKMWEYFTLDGHFGNPSSSSHLYGLNAKLAVDEARQSVANLIYAEATEIIWTSGATEAINLALKGATQLYQRKGKHVVTMKTEHKAVLDSCQELEKNGYQVTYLTPEPNGLLDIDKLKQALRTDTILVAIMHVNNETGVIQDINSIAKLTAERDILFFVDAVQSAGKLPINVREMSVDLIAFSAHKIYGPKGMGALYVRRKPRVKVAAQIHGGGQEQGMRAGTLATHQIVGMGEAFRIAKLQMVADYDHVDRLRAVFLKRIRAMKNVSLNSQPDITYPGIVNLCFTEYKSEIFMKKLPELAISSGSACLSKGIEPSYVLRAMGLSMEASQTGIRFSFGRFTTMDEMEWVSARLTSL